MTFTEVVKKILQENGAAMTPQEIREVVKRDYPEYYGTTAHRSNVEKGHYKDIDHALLAQVYTLVKTNDSFSCDKTSKPLRVSLISDDIDLPPVPEDYESDDGIVYVLKTETFTKDGKEIVKIGFTTQDVDIRISQLYTTGVPFKFRVHTAHRTKNFVELETAIHKLLDPFKLNQSREFFTEDAIPFITDIVELHEKIQETAHSKN